VFSGLLGRSSAALGGPLYPVTPGNAAERPRRPVLGGKFWVGIVGYATVWTGLGQNWRVVSDHLGPARKNLYPESNAGFNLGDRASGTEPRKKDRGKPHRGIVGARRAYFATSQWPGTRPDSLPPPSPPSTMAINAKAFCHQQNTGCGVAAGRGLRQAKSYEFTWSSRMRRFCGRPAKNTVPEK